MKIAKKLGHTCPECGRLVPKYKWNTCLKRGHCSECHFGMNWSKGIGAGGSARYDNRDRESEREIQSQY